MKVTRETLHGAIPAVVTPFAENGEIMKDAFVQLVDWLIAQGANGICVAGDNGESWTLSAEERALLTRLAVETSRGRVPVMCGATAASAGGSVAYAQAARDAGADGLLLMPQTYVLKASRDELLRRFEAVAKAVDLPIVAYNSPRRTSIDLSLDDLDALLGVAPIVGLKESNRDFFHHTHLIERFRERIAVLIGPCHYILPGVALGAQGFIATGPELLGERNRMIMDVARRAPDENYRKLHVHLTTIYQALMGTGTWPAAFKAALNLLGQPAGVPRDPVMPLGGAELERLRQTMIACEMISA
ncbi:MULTISPECIES: dihydrodipicolinate synthase family protein [unclassified Chelatococcus]|uniref:dihydrodipicolinate synthase family protein n=1 Tax=unclassified Chelatococcus TaxID=2638111 RepID=UPI0020BE5C9D|nr:MULTISPECIES: dihydrodipicolinate synthase family protein [unclassified Chelatococcus]MCO5074091.1 dihydrodipicolinate synthase family protein [Chelatococcus sp.]CAH1653710.1 Dihydrodipicolinate synthase [Hyphomicrobiales bacterium]CAH1694578.1 Dihydrodipicolinate synthase [Hyphomicrobiales bacterium]